MARLTKDSVIPQFGTLVEDKRSGFDTHHGRAYRCGPEELQVVWDGWADPFINASTYPIGWFNRTRGAKLELLGLSPEQVTEVRLPKALKQDEPTIDLHGTLQLVSDQGKLIINRQSFYAGAKAAIKFARDDLWDSDDIADAVTAPQRLQYILDIVYAEFMHEAEPDPSESAQEPPQYDQYDRRKHEIERNAYLIGHKRASMHQAEHLRSILGDAGMAGVMKSIDEQGQEDFEVDFPL